MKTILATFLATTLLASLAGDASAASTKRGYKAMSCNPRTGVCRPATAPLRSPRGYLPPRKRASEYDYPPFGSQRWWREQEDQD